MGRRLSATMMAALLLAACHGGKAMMPEDRTDSAVQQMDNAHARRSERGTLQVELDAPHILKYDKPHPRTVYRGADTARVAMRIYDDQGRLRTSIEAGWAESLDDRDIMTAYDSVVVTDYANGDTVYLQTLVWDKADDRIYSDRPVRVVNGQRITEGDGFTSDQRMENISITRQRGRIEFEE